ncbi:MAG: DoxX family protein [Dehalococcoidia bacterium]|nr:DoxX family protein [Dehalococcoidia bacterium]
MSTDISLLILRLVVGGIIMAHGSQKLFGWFGGYGFAGTRGFMGGMLRLRPASFWTAMAVVSELGGGLLFALGLLNPFGALGIIAAMTTAIVLAHWGKFWASNSGMEHPLVILVAALSGALSGPGSYSLDAATGVALPGVATLAAGIVAIVVGLVIALKTRTPVPAAALVEEDVSLPTAA